MRFLRKLFGKKVTVSVGAVNSTVGTGPAPTGAPPPADPARVADGIRVYDAYGRELSIPREQWREHVLPGHLAKVRDEPDLLAASLLEALRNGFADEVLDSAEHLAQTDPDAERGTVVLALVHRECRRGAEAERVLREFLAVHGETGVVLANLGDLLAERGEDEESAEVLGRALELDPNLDNALARYLAQRRSAGGEAAVGNALRELAERPGSWRARLWLARDALRERRLEAALGLYREALELAPRPVPADLLVQMSGDLGNAAHLPELLTLVGPWFDVGVHGLPVGNNLIKALLDLGRLDEARTLLDRLHACRRPDWKASLERWDGELARARVAITPVPPEAQVEFVMLHGDGPVWLPPASPAAELFPAPGGERLRIAFLGSSGETVARSGKVVAQLSDGPGRVSRALPVFLAEQVFFHGHAQVRPLMPWVRGDATAFVFSGDPWPAGEAARQAGLLEPAADYVVVTHLRVVADPWRVELRLVRTIDAQVLGTLEADFPMHRPEEALLRLARELIALLEARAAFVVEPPPAAYRVPEGGHFAHYLLRLEQLLAVRCHMADETAERDLHGEREIVEGSLHLCLAQPDNVVPRLLLAEVLRRMVKLVPQVVAEFREKIELLQREHPLAGAERAVVGRLFDELYD